MPVFEFSFPYSSAMKNEILKNQTLAPCLFSVYNAAMTETVTKEKLVNDVKEVISDAEALIHAAGDDLRGKASEARDKLSVKLAAARERLKHLEGVVREKAIEGAKQTDRVIREHPYESIGVAFGVGLLLGILINRR